MLDTLDRADGSLVRRNGCTRMSSPPGARKPSRRAAPGSSAGRRNNLAPGMASLAGYFHGTEYRMAQAAFVVDAREAPAPMTMSQWVQWCVAMWAELTPEQRHRAKLGFPERENDRGMSRTFVVQEDIVDLIGRIADADVSAAGGLPWRGRAEILYEALQHRVEAVDTRLGGPLRPHEGRLPPVVHPRRS